jgi:PAS domain S-box-containing protein
LIIDQITTADTIAEAMGLLEQNTFSIIFLDLFLPDSAGLETFQQLVKLTSKIPVIISSGLSDTSIAVKAISMGAQDFLIKGDYTSTLLEKAVRYGIERKDAELLIKSSEEKYRYLFDNNPATIFIWDQDNFRILNVNNAAVNLFGYTREEFLQKTLLELHPENERTNLRQVGKKRQAEYTTSGIWKHFNKEGETIHLDISSHTIVYLGKQVILSLANDITERILLEEKLAEERIKKQQEITAAIINAQEQERSFLGTELHDNINQILAVANLYIDCALSDEESRINLMKESKQLVKDAMEEIRKLSKTLLPPSLGEVGLQETLNDVIEKIKLVNDGVHFLIDWKIPDENTLNEKLKLTIYRIVQEQLNNIFKHAKASNIIITIQQEGEILRLSIKDDGIGFDPAKKRNGVGLQNITSRAGLLNGTVLIKSSPGAGCELIIDFICINSMSNAIILRA